MKCHVPGPNVKVLRRSIHTLARFGDELYLESYEDCILLKTLSSAESAYAMIKFNKNFFSHFNYNYCVNEDNEGLKFKISMKSALNVFKSPTHLDKQVENLEIKLDPDESKLIFQLKCKDGIVKTHFVCLLEFKSLQAVCTKDLVPNRVTSSQRVLSEALNNFQTSDDQITLEASSQVLLIRNYIDAAKDLSKIIRTQISMKPSEFVSYNITTATIITFTLKEFRALLAFAEALSLPIQLHFEVTGCPVVFIIHNGTTFEANFILSTCKPDIPTQATTQNSTRSEKRKSKTRESVEKKAHLDDDVARCLDEDSHLFNYIDMPDENLPNITNGNGVCDEIMDCDNIPASPTSRIKIKSVFKRCFESTFNPKSFQQVVLAENSDSD